MHREVFGHDGDSILDCKGLIGTRCASCTRGRRFSSTERVEGSFQHVACTLESSLQSSKVNETYSCDLLDTYLAVDFVTDVEIPSLSPSRSAHTNAKVAPGPIAQVLTPIDRQFIYHFL